MRKLLREKSHRDRMLPVTVKLVCLMTQLTWYRIGSFSVLMDYKTVKATVTPLRVVAPNQCQETPASDLHLSSQGLYNNSAPHQQVH
jgi:hypothetical protein